MSFCAAVDFGHIDEAIRELDYSVTQIKQSTAHLQALTQLRKVFPAFNRSKLPWEHGYDCARALSEHLALNGGIPRGLDGVARALGVDSAALTQAILTPHKPEAFAFDALVGTNAHGSPAFVIAKVLENTRQFALCRCLYAYLMAVQRTALGIVSTARSDHQQANRAFAAEFLAPAATLRLRLRGSTVNDEQIEDLASEFGVSSLVIRHQIGNHRLATIEPT